MGNGRKPRLDLLWKRDEIDYDPFRKFKGGHLINSLTTPDKAIASHRIYRRPLMVMQENSG